MNNSELMKFARELVVALFAFVALILLCSEPADDEAWTKVFLASKGIGFLIGYISYKLFCYWDSKGSLTESFKDDEI